MVNVHDSRTIRDEAPGQTLCVAFDSREKYLAVTAVDGLLRIYDMSTIGGAPKPVTLRISEKILDRKAE